MYIYESIASNLSKNEMFQTKYMGKIKTHFMLSNIFRKSRPLWDNVEKYDSQTGHRCQYNVVPALCMLDD